MTSKTRAVIAALVLAIPVAVEAFWLHSDDGLAGHLAFAVSQLVGWTLVLVVVRTLGRHEAGRRWPRVVQGGVVLQAAFATAYGLGAAVTGEPWERVFVLFLLGFLMLTVGGVVWGVRLLRLGLLEAGLGLVLVGALGFLAVAVGVSPWHDLVLLGSYLAWVPVGIGTDRLRSAPTPAGQEQRSGAAAQTAGPVPG